MRIRLLLLLLCLSWPIPATSHDLRPQTWIVWGQSNALGCAPGPLWTGLPLVTAWNHYRWGSAAEILPFMTPNDYCTSVGGSGWVVQTANAYAWFARQPVKLTGHAEGSRRIYYWSQDPGPSLITDNLVAAADATWMIAYQGESEAYHGDTDWAEQFRIIVAAVRAATNPNLKVLVVGLGDEPTGFCPVPNCYAAVRAQQRAYVASDPLALFISAEGCARQSPDNPHLSRAGYTELARRVLVTIATEWPLW